MVWTPPNTNAGQYPNASDLEYGWDQVVDLTHPGWNDFSTSLVITGSTTSPTPGNSTRQAFWRRPPESDWIIYVFKYTIGSTFGAGSGTYSFNLPVAMMSPNIFTGHTVIFDITTAVYQGTLLASSPTDVITYRDGSANALAATGPGTAWATGDFVSGQIVYAPA